MLLDLSKKEDYDIASGLRGPDHKRLHRSKHVFTGLVRYYAGVEHGQGPLVRDAPIRIWHINGVCEEMHEAFEGGEALYNAAAHYIFHVMKAAQALARRAVGPYAIEHLELVFEIADDLYQGFYCHERQPIDDGLRVLKDLYEHEDKPEWGYNDEV
jgi:hypothetical protein